MTINPQKRNPSGICSNSWIQILSPLENEEKKKQQKIFDTYKEFIKKTDIFPGHQDRMQKMYESFQRMIQYSFNGLDFAQEPQSSIIFDLDEGIEKELAE